MSNRTKDSIPTEGEDELKGTLEKVAKTGEAKCRLCEHTVTGDNFGEIFEKLARHGEEKHEWDDKNGWSVK